MKIIAFFCMSCLMILPESYSQNYQCIPLNAEIIFEPLLADNNGKKYFKFIRIDSLANNGTFTELINYSADNSSTVVVFEGKCYEQNKTCLNFQNKNNTNYLPYHFTGIQIYSYLNGDFKFINSKKDTILIKTFATSGQNWKFTDTLTAHISSHDTMSFLGIQDSVKVISISNGDEIILSKNYGFIKSLDYYYYPDSSISYNLIGLSNPNLGVQRPKRKEIYDFNIGDLFQYDLKYTLDIPMSHTKHTHWQKELLIIDKKSFIDSVSYTVLRKTFMYLYYPPIYKPHEFLKLITDTFMLNYGKLNNHIINHLPDELDTTLKYIIPHRIFYDECNTITIASGNVYSTSSHDSCYCIRGSVNEAYNYKTGLGNTYEDVYEDPYSVPYNIRTTILKYSDKGNWSCGNRFFIGIDEKNNANEDVKLFPNPTSGIFFIDLSSLDITVNSITISDITGRLLKNHTLERPANTMNFDLSDYSKGIYFITVYSSNGIVITKKLILN